MALRGDETYVRLNGRLKRRTDKAAMIETDIGEGWVPRSCMHFATDKAIDDMELGQEAEFQIMEWVAEREELV